MLKTLFEFIDLIKADPMKYAIYAGAGLGGLIALAIILKIVIACVKHSKKKKAIANGTYVKPLTRKEEKALEKQEKAAKKAEKLAKKQAKKNPAPVEEAPAEEAIEEQPTEEEITEPVAEETPVEEAPVEPVAEETTEEQPVEEQPAEEVQAEEQPVEEVPVEPVAEETTEEQPVEEQSAEEVQAEETPVEEVPVEPVAEETNEEQPVEEQPAEEDTAEPVEELSAEEVQAEETAEPVVEETPVEEAPVEEVQAEEQPVEETPVVEEKVEEPIQEEPIEEVKAEEETPAPVEEKVEEPVQEQPAEEEKPEEPKEVIDYAEKYIPLGPLVNQPTGGYQEFFHEDGTVNDKVENNDDIVLDEPKKTKPKKITYNYSFEAKVILADDKVKKHYSTVKNFVESFISSHGRLVPNNKQWSAEVFGASTRYAKLRFNKSTLVLALPLNPTTQDEKYNVTASKLASDEATPCLCNLTSDKACKLACELLGKVLESNGYSKTSHHEKVDYAPATEDEQTLIDKGLIKVSGGEQAPAPAPVEEAPKVEEEPEEPAYKPQVVKKTLIKCSFSFEATLSQCNDNIKVYYSEVRNLLDAYNCVGALSWKSEIFVLNGKKVAMIRGNRKELIVNTCLPIKDVKPKFKAVYDSAMADLPTVVKIYTDSGLDLAKELIDISFESVGAVKNPNQKYTDYVAKHPFIYTKELIKKGLVKEISETDLNPQ